MTRKRRELLIELEKIVGAQCWNSNIRNGQWDRGRRFQYPISFPPKTGRRSRPVLSRVSDKTLLQGHYLFGANKLFVFRALHRVLAHLEKTQGLHLEELGELQHGLTSEIQPTVSEGVEANLVAPPVGRSPGTA